MFVGRRGTARRFAIFPGRRENFEEKVSKEDEEEDEEDEEETMTMMSPFHHPQTTEKLQRRRYGRRRREQNATTQHPPKKPPSMMTMAKKNKKRVVQRYYKTKDASVKAAVEKDMEEEIFLSERETREKNREKELEDIKWKNTTDAERVEELI